MRVPQADAACMWLDLVALVLLTCFATLGALKGAIKSLFGLLSLLAGYLAAIVLSPVIGPALAPTLGIPELIGIVLAGTGVFILAFGGVGIAGNALARMTRRRDGTRSPRDRFLGGAFGALRGLLVVVLVSWLAVWIDALRVSGVAPNLPAMGESAAASVSTDLIESGIGVALADAGTGGRVVARLAAHPGTALTEARALVDDPRISKLAEDEMFWTYVEHGNVDAAMNRMAFGQLTRDDAFRERLGALALVSDESVRDPRAFREEFGGVLAEVGPRIQGLREDPELRALARDPEVIAMLQNGDTLSLLGHPGIQSLVERVSPHRTSTQ